MWLMTKHGFYSIVQKTPGEFHVRARVHKDLENLVERACLSGALIHFGKATDYPYRLVVSQRDVLLILKFLGETLDYSNFKNAVAQSPDQSDKFTVYERLWRILLDKFGGYGNIFGKNRIEAP